MGGTVAENPVTSVTSAVSSHMFAALSSFCICTCTNDSKDLCVKWTIPLDSLSHPWNQVGIGITCGNFAIYTLETMVRVFMQKFYIAASWHLLSLRKCNVLIGMVL